MLARYKNYVSEASDFPVKFTSRNSAASQAIGYGKTLMLWHMLRSELGDELFIEGLQALYSEYKYKEHPLRISKGCSLLSVGEIYRYSLTNG